MPIKSEDIELLVDKSSSLTESITDSSKSSVQIKSEEILYEYSEGERAKVLRCLKLMRPSGFNRIKKKLQSDDS